jgi:hypothetical protein
MLCCKASPNLRVRLRFAPCLAKKIRANLFSISEWDQYQIRVGRAVVKALPGNKVYKI